MTQRARTAFGRISWFVMVAALLAGTSRGAYSATENPLEPPDRSSPRATLTTFLDSLDATWKLYSAGNPGYNEPFRDARECLDLSEIPPLVLHQVSADSALVLKEVLDRIELPPSNQTPDRAVVEELGLTRWTLPHTEIHLVRIAEGDRHGQWVFSTGTVARVEEFYNRVRHLPYRPGRTGGHLEELRAGSKAIFLMKLAKGMPPWFRSEIGGMLAWQWFGLALLVLLLGLAVVAVAWLSRRWRDGSLFGHRLASFLVPLALVSIPVVGAFIIRRLFELPGAPAFVVRLLFSIVGYFGLAWLVALVLTRIGDLVVRFWFRRARPLRKQLVRVVFRIATIVVVTAVVLKAAQILGAPVTGLIAGLGVGGLAIALAAQGTLENFIGGIILYTDQPVKVGDFCRFGDKRGTVEDVGLRSVKVRTLDRTVVTVPNASFANLQLENLTERDHVLLREEICLRYETTREQLQWVLSELEAMLENHAQIADEALRVRFTGFGRYYLEIELFAYAMTSAWPEFLSIRQDVLVKVMEIIGRSGTRLALPTEVHYSARDVEGSDAHGTPPESPA
jgi:MscS family membrane protein